MEDILSQKMAYNREEYNLFRITRADRTLTEESFSEADTVENVSKLLKKKANDIGLAAKYRAMYVAVADGYFHVFEEILKSIGNKPWNAWDAWKEWEKKSNENRTGGDKTSGDKSSAIKFLLGGTKDGEVNGFDIYFRDRDGQSFMHYIAKDGHFEDFKNLIDQGCNPLVRDRFGKTAWDLAVQRESFDLAKECKALDSKTSKVPPSLIKNYATETYIPDEYTRSPTPDKSDRIICVVQLHETTEPSDKIRFSPSEFLDEKNGRWQQPLYSTILESIEENKKCVWIQLDRNDDVLFTSLINEVCAIKQYDMTSIAQIFDFHARTFLEQDHGEPRLKFREPLYTTTSLDATFNIDEGEEHGRNESGRMATPTGKVEITSMVVSYFDSGDPEGGDRRSLLASDEKAAKTEKADKPTKVKRPKKKSWKNTYLQRTLEETYYLGLDSKQLKQRDYRKILERKKFKPKSTNILMISQFWLWKIDNVVITALPRKTEYISSHIFDHTLSLLRGVGPDARKQLTSNQLAAWIFSESVHRLDYPCMADLEEPILYFLGRVIAVTLNDVVGYIGSSGTDKVDIVDGTEFIQAISAARSKLLMIKNILLRQEDVWKLIDEKLSTTIWKTDPDKAVLTEVKRLTERPCEDLATFKKRIERIEEDAERAESWILIQLDLKAKHDSTILNMAVMGFAVVTIVFAPLSFLTSLFALPIDQLQNHYELPSLKYPAGYIRKWMTIGEVVSLAVALILVTLSVRVIQLFQRHPIRFLRLVKKIWSTLQLGFNFVAIRIESWRKSRSKAPLLANPPPANPPANSPANPDSPNITPMNIV